MVERICVTCGNQQTLLDDGFDLCPICEDERQWVPEGGQKWTSSEMLHTSHKVDWQEQAKGIWSLRIAPTFAIGQRAFLIERTGGNILWDCISLLDEATRTRILGLGGLSAIAISHPHFYSVVADWGRAFDCPIYAHADDAEWVQQPIEYLEFWEGETLTLTPEATVIRCGGHFSGSSALHVAHVNREVGALFSSDTLQVALDRKHVSFMRSFPNMLPLNADAVRRIAQAIEPYEFDAIYGAFPDRTIPIGAKQAVRRSVERYIRAIAP